MLERRAERWRNGLAVTAVRTGQMGVRLAALLPGSTSTNSHQTSWTLPVLGRRWETTYCWQPAPSVPRCLTHRSVEHGRHSIFNGDGLSRRVHLRNVSSILHREMDVAASEVILSGRKKRLIDCHLRLLKTLRHPTDPVRFVQVHEVEYTPATLSPNHQPPTGDLLLQTSGCESSWWYWTPGLEGKPRGGLKRRG